MTLHEILHLGPFSIRAFLNPKNTVLRDQVRLLHLGRSALGAKVLACRRVVGAPGVELDVKVMEMLISVQACTDKAPGALLAM